MKNVMLLDCTLRDGGRIIDCSFNDKEIKELSDGLSDSHIDVIEVGFLRDWRSVDYKGGSTFFTDVSQIAKVIGKKNPNVIYVAFIDYGMFDFDSLKSFDGSSIDGIRFGFTKKDYNENYEDLIRCMNVIKKAGYKLFIQGVNSLNYSDMELLQLIKMVNEIKPYSFGIVDTYGAMYIDDIDRIYGLIDNNMNNDICLDFHSHNNFQMSFALAQEVIKLSKGVRKTIIDGTLYGMGKVSGNLNLELIATYLVQKLKYNYDLDRLYDLIDDYIYKYTLNDKWGYSIPALMSGIYRSHPNNVIYLTKKFRVDSKDIGKILSLIDAEKRQRYDYENIERIYIEYMSKKVEDCDVLDKLKRLLSGKDLLVLAPGNSLNTYRKQIESFIIERKPIVVTINFIGGYKGEYAFFGNVKRYKNVKSPNDHIILTSNIKPLANELVVNYQNLIERGYKYFDNSMIMLLNLLKKLMPSSIYIAGFDGFNVKTKTNYMDESFQNDRHVEEFELQNKELRAMFNNIFYSIRDRIQVVFVTPSVFCDESLL